jgi:hypothetical protein
MGIIDARVRLPQDKRAGSYTAPPRQTEQYDKVLDLTAKMNGGTLDGLLAELDRVGIDRAVMHAESEGGEDAEALNAALADREGREVPSPGGRDRRLDLGRRDEVMTATNA